MKHCLVSRKRRKLHRNRCDIVQCIVICLFEVISNKSHTFPYMVMVDTLSIFLIVIFLIGMECLNLIRLISLFCRLHSFFTYTVNYSFKYYLRVRFLFFENNTEKVFTMRRIIVFDWFVWQCNDKIILLYETETVALT